MTDDAAFDPLAIVRALNAEAVDYVVVGGLAVAAYGVIRATQDLDLGVPTYADLLPPAVVSIDGERVPVASLLRLTEMKRISGRPKDLVDLAELEAMGSDS